VHRRKLIEVALPLEAINRESAREKSIRHGHPSTLHIWWARRPLAAARAVLFAQLVDDPSARPEEFPTEEAQRRERERLHRLIERLAVWENLKDDGLFKEASAEIHKSTDGAPPAVVDPFAGGGTIPLEAQRLGLEVHASDLNPVAVLINKALIEIPPKFSGQPPLFPGIAETRLGDWPRTAGLAEDVRQYGTWMRDRAIERIGHLYPPAEIPVADHNGDPTSTSTNANVVAWIWARAVTCPNPACGISMPLVRSWWLSKKKGKEAYIVPTLVEDVAAPGGRQVRFGIGTDPTKGPAATADGTVARTAATCIACASPVPLPYVRAEGRAGRLGSELMAVIAEGRRQRVYLAPTDTHRQAANIARPDSTPVGSLPPHGLSPANPQTIRIYGFNEWADLFTPRQLTTLSTLSDLVGEVRARVIGDGGTESYADAIATYLAFAVSGMTNLSSSMVSWASTGEFARGVFARQAIPMVWDFCETAPLGTSTGGFIGQVEWAAKACDLLPANSPAVVQQADAAARDYTNLLIATDPPYYDNIGYSDLSDYFYVWLRRTLRDVYPDLLTTMLVPKAEELVANPHRHNGKQGAKEFFENGFRQVFAHARRDASTGFPITVYYAFKQAEASEEGEASTGWETLLEGMIRSGWEITSTWPMRSERSGRTISLGSNALASSIVLSLRPRPDCAPTTDRRGFIAALEAELPDALRKLQQGQIAPVDLPQAAIGPGMAVFSRYSAVLDPDGSKMTVRAALARINEILDQVLNEQEGDFDATSRFAIAWYRQYGYGIGKFGDADNLARARNTSVDTLERDEILTSRAGHVQLIKPADLSWNYDVLKDVHISNWEVLHHLIKVLERDGIAPTGDLLQAALSRPDGAVDADLVKELAHLLFRIAEGSGWTKDALNFNTLVTSWPEILEVARSMKKTIATQGALEFDEGDD
jgi:putative DNA methylase